MTNQKSIVILPYQTNMLKNHTIIKCQNLNEISFELKLKSGFEM